MGEIVAKRPALRTRRVTAHWNGWNAVTRRYCFILIAQNNCLPMLEMDFVIMMDKIRTSVDGMVVIVVRNLVNLVSGTHATPQKHPFDVRIPSLVIAPLLLPLRPQWDQQL